MTLQTLRIPLQINIWRNPSYTLYLPSRPGTRNGCTSVTSAVQSTQFLPPLTVEKCLQSCRKEGKTSLLMKNKGLTFATKLFAMLTWILVNIEQREFRPTFNQIWIKLLDNSPLFRCRLRSIWAKAIWPRPTGWYIWSRIPFCWHEAIRTREALKLRCAARFGC